LKFCLLLPTISHGAVTTTVDRDGGFEEIIEEGGALSDYLKNFNSREKEEVNEEMEPSFVDQLVTAEEFLKLTDHEYDVTPATRKPYNYKLDRKVVEDMDKMEDEDKDAESDEGKDDKSEIVIKVLEDSAEIDPTKVYIKFHNKEYRRMDDQKKVLIPQDYYELLKETNHQHSVPEVAKTDRDVDGNVNQKDKEVVEKLSSPVDRSDSVEINLDLEDLEDVFLDDGAKEKWGEDEIIGDDDKIEELSLHPKYTRTKMRNVKKPTEDDVEEVKQEEEEESSGFLNFISGLFGWF